MRLHIQKSEISGSLQLPVSKSHAQRAILCAALAPGESVLEGYGPSDDTRLFTAASQALGARARQEENTLYIQGRPAGSPLPPSPPDIELGESGAALRFLPPVFAALGVQAAFHGRGRLAQRPVGAMLTALTGAGAVFNRPGLPFTLEKGVDTNRYTIDGSASSQYVSGLLFAAAAAGGGSVTVTGKAVSAGYIDLTVDTLAAFGVSVLRENGCFLVTGSPRPATLFLQPDASAAAAAACLAAAAGGRVTFPGARNALSQPDGAFAPLLEQAGCVLSWAGDDLTVAGPVLRPVSFDMEPCPDLAVPVAAMAAGQPGLWVLRGCGRLRTKESDRLSGLARMVRGVGGTARIEGDTLYITGQKNLTGGRVDAAGDHRLIMAGAILAMSCAGGVTVDSALPLRKSWPGFLESFSHLGGKYDQI